MMGEQMKKYSTASLGLMIGTFALTRMLMAFMSFRTGWPPDQL